jgi:hypothetical protein
MGNTRPIGGGSPPQPPAPAAGPAETNPANQPQSQDVGGGQPAQSPRTSERDAAQRRTEHGMGGLAREAELRGRAETSSSDISRTLTSARSAGLNPQELQRLETRLNGMSEEARSAETRFLSRNVFGTPNSDRALRTYMDVRDLQERYPTRISDNHVHTLTRAVAEPRSQTRNGLEGMMSHQQALNSALALTLMSDQHHARFQQTLDRAATHGGTAIPGSDPHYERALLLESLGARTSRLSETDSGRLGPTDPMPRNSSYLQEIEQYSDGIRGHRREELIRRSTMVDIQGDGSRPGGLQQAFQHSCAPTTSQIARAESDPISAWAYHRNPGMVITEQRIQLQQGGGRPVLRGEEGGRGMPISDLLNSRLSPYTGQTYANNPVADSAAGRQAAMDQMDQRLREGNDVPIRVAWSDTNAHFLLATDVRGTGNNRDFFITDPWTGRSRWYSQTELAGGQTNFPGTGTGRLANIYVPSQELH